MTLSRVEHALGMPCEFLSRAVFATLTLVMGPLFCGQASAAGDAVGAK